MKSVKFKTILSFLLLVSMLLFTAVGCGSAKSPTSDAAKDSAPKTAEYTDMVGRKVVLKTDVKRIVAVRYMDIYYLSAILGKELDDKLLSLGMNYKQNDIDGYKKFSEVYKNLNKLVEVGSIYDDAISLESMVKLDPDMIIADKQFYNYSCLNKMIEAGLPVVFTDFNTDPFYGPENSIKMIGKMLGKEEYVNGMADYANGRTAAVLDRVKQLEVSNVKKPKLYFECGNVSPTEIGGTRGDTSNGWGYLWDKLGADNIGVGSKNNALNLEQILVANPDVIVIGGANWNPDGNIMRMGFYVTPQSASDHLALYTKRAGWSDLSAIKNDRLYALHFNYFVHPYSFAGVEAMAKFLYPDKFTDLDPEKDMKDFFDKYMPVKYSGLFSADWIK
jgi:iron complex transport system substrate-binding protein